MLNFIRGLDKLIVVALTVLYLYQMGYLLVGFLSRFRKEKYVPKKLHKFAVLVSARNEGEVIAELIGSLKAQDYPAELLDIYIVADNCTDDTAQRAREAGAFVYERFDRVRVGKGYALDDLLRQIKAGRPDAGYEGFFVFDADNLVDGAFVSEMNKVFDRGYKAVTCYRNSKNFGANWISAGYSVWFLREARFLNAARMRLGTSCAVSGTGFLVSAELIEENGGWPYHLLTEDIEFSTACILKGVTIGYCDAAVVYDEQPTTFRQSWDQRLRWSKGFYQVGGRYGGSLLKGCFRGGRAGMSCYDMLMTIAPGTLLTVFGLLMNGVVVLACLSEPVWIYRKVLSITGDFLWAALFGFYIGLFCYGLLTVLCEWKRIRATPLRKLGYLITFPLFMMTYIPISVVALVRKVEWKPIRHTSMRALEEAS